MSSNPSKVEALFHLEENILPRRIQDVERERAQFEKTDSTKPIYRKVAPDESDRGELYPVWNAGLATFAHFGVGVGIYFMQLLILCGVFFISGMIMLMAINSYRTTTYGLTTTRSLFTISAACRSFVNVTATIGCDGGAPECIISMRPECELPYNAALADLIMSLFFMAAIYCARFVEKRIEKNLDESVQTAQDYSVEVADPDADADNPDEWYKYFSRFGTVRYITITRRNNDLLLLVVQKHRLVRKLEELEKLSNAEQRLSQSVAKSALCCCGPSGNNHAQVQRKKEYYAVKLAHINAVLDNAFMRAYPACRVYVTFEHEEHQRLCLRDLEVPDYQAIFDIKSKNINQRKLFRGTNVLDILEPPEPDNLIWANLQVSRYNRNVYTVITALTTIGVLAACYYLITYTQRVNAAVLSIVIGVVDAILPNIFEILTNLSSPISEGRDRQSDLQVKLFATRLLLSTIFPYVQASWRVVLDSEFITQIMSVQIAACFTSTVLDLLDVPGLITRHITAPLFSDSQAEMNLKYSGKEWSLAEKYTGLAKILFISLYYAILTPLSLLIATVAFFLVFLVDRYQLLRKWKPIAMLDAKIATRLRQQAMLGVAAHMYVTARFIYSWPMDAAYLRDAENMVYEKVNKEPNLAIWSLFVQDWHNDAQKRLLVPYKIAFLVVASITVYIWIVSPVIKTLRGLFCYQVRDVGRAQGIPFSSISNIRVYVPIVCNMDEQFICCYTNDLLPQHKPSLVKYSPDHQYDITHYVPEKFQSHVLAVVKYYGHDPEMPSGAEKGAKVKIVEQKVVAKMKKQLSYRQVATLDDSAPEETEQFKLVTNPQSGFIEKVRVGLPDDLVAKLQAKEVPRHSSRRPEPVSAAEERRRNRVAEGEEDDPFSESLYPPVVRDSVGRDSGRRGRETPVDRSYSRADGGVERGQDRERDRSRAGSTPVDREMTPGGRDKRVFPGQTGDRDRDSGRDRPARQTMPKEEEKEWGGGRSKALSNSGTLGTLQLELPEAVSRRDRSRDRDRYGSYIDDREDEEEELSPVDRPVRSVARGPSRGGASSSTDMGRGGFNRTAGSGTTPGSGSSRTRLEPLSKTLGATPSRYKG